MIEQMQKPADRDEILRQLHELSLEDREYIAAELLRAMSEAGVAIDGTIESDPGFREELRERARHAVEHAGEGFSNEQIAADVRAMLAAKRAQRR